MTGVVHHGPSGSFKSFTLVQRTMIPALIGKPKVDSEGNQVKDEEGNPVMVGRTVVTNIRGFDSLERIEKALDVKLAPDSEIIYVNPEGGKKAWEAMRYFFHWVPLGALICFDEAAKIYPKKRIRNFNQFDLPLFDEAGNPNSDEYIKELCPLWDGDRERPETLEEAIDLHRHYHWDVYYSCTNISKLHDEFRHNIEVAHRHKSLGELIPWKKNKWKEFSHDAENNGKSLSHHQGTPKEYKADLRIFDCYMSTKDGKAKHSPENRSIFRDPKLQAFGVFFLVFLLGFIYFGVQAALTSPWLRSDDTQALQVDGEGASEIDSNALSSPSVLDTHQTSNKVVSAAVEALSVSQADLVPEDPIAKLYDSGNQFYLAAYLETSTTKKIFYRLVVHGPSGVLDRFDQEQVKYFGYSASYSTAGLTLIKGDLIFLIRPIPYDKDMLKDGGGASPNAAMQGPGGAQRQALSVFTG